MSLIDGTIEVAYMARAGGWAWRCWACDRNHLGYGDDREKASKDAAVHERRTHREGVKWT